MDILVFHNNRDFKEQIEYTFGTLLSIIGLDYKFSHSIEEASKENAEIDRIVIHYSHDDTVPKSRFVIRIWPSGFFGKGYLTRQSLPRTPLNRTQEGVPVIYSGGSRKEGVWVKKSEHYIETNIDIIASSFFMLSRYEEVVKDEKDQFGRFPASAAIAYQEGFLDRPIVNEYIEMLWDWIDGSNLGLKRGELWGGEDFAVCLTHDVDIVKKKTIPWASNEVLSIGSSIKHGQFRRAGNKGKDFALSLLRKDPYWNFDYILDKETSDPETNSSFYFRVGGSTGKDYKTLCISDRRMKQLIRKIESKGCEVGLHPSFNTYNDIELMRRESMKLDDVVQHKSYGSRQHFLRWKTPDTWRILEKAGIKYDMTLCFPEYVGFRCGICLPYQPFDIIEKRKMNIWELPLVFMEATLFKYRGVTPQKGLEVIQHLVNIVRKYHGVFTLLWHNDLLDEAQLPGWQKVYEQTVELVRSYSIFRKSGVEIIDWWENRISK